MLVVVVRWVGAVVAVLELVAEDLVMVVVLDDSILLVLFFNSFLSVAVLVAAAVVRAADGPGYRGLRV